MDFPIQKIARFGGLLYLVIILAGTFEELFVRSHVIVSQDAAATASNLLGSDSLWRIGFAGSIVMLICAVALTLIFYLMLRPVNPYLALMAVLFNLVSMAMEGVIRFLGFQALLIVQESSNLKGLNPEQLHDLAMLFTNMHGYGFGASLVFFGMDELLRGYLMLRSGFFPKFLGVLVIVSGMSYLINSFALFLSPTFSGWIYPAILFPAGLPELIFAIWLLIAGVNVIKWQEMTSAQRQKFPWP